MVDSLRQALHEGWQPFVEGMSNRIRELSINMVNGQVLAARDADRLKQELLLFVREEALPILAEKNPAAGLQVLNNMAAHGMPELESERQAIIVTRNADYLVPDPAELPALDMLRGAAADAEVCTIAQPVTNMYFAEGLKADEGLVLPEDLLAVYAAADGFDLSLAVEKYIPVFSLLPSESIDVSEQTGKYPKRAVVFQGGDSVHLAIYRDQSRVWWLVYEYQYEPEAKIRYDLPALLQFGIERMNAPSLEALGEAQSWEHFFGVEDD